MHVSGRLLIGKNTQHDQGYGALEKLQDQQATEKSSSPPNWSSTPFVAQLLWFVRNLLTLPCYIELPAIRPWWTEQHQLPVTQSVHEGLGSKLHRTSVRKSRSRRGGLIDVNCFCFRNVLGGCKSLHAYIAAQALAH